MEGRAGSVESLSPVLAPLLSDVGIPSTQGSQPSPDQQTIQKQISVKKICVGFVPQSSSCGQRWRGSPRGRRKRGLGGRGLQAPLRAGFGPGSACWAACLRGARVGAAAGLLAGWLGGSSFQRALGSGPRPRSLAEEPAQRSWGPVPRGGSPACLTPSVSWANSLVIPELESRDVGTQGVSGGQPSRSCGRQEPEVQHRSWMRPASSHWSLGRWLTRSP